MGSIGFWIAYCVGFGILGGGLYTYMSGRKKKALDTFCPERFDIYGLCLGLCMVSLQGCLKPVASHTTIRILSVMMIRLSTHYRHGTIDLFGEKEPDHLMGECHA